MLDGFKIEVQSQTAQKWLTNDLLLFHQQADVRTSKMLGNTSIAKYKGLVFSITKSVKHENIQYCVVRGSLHKYWNNGKHNANDFTFSELKKVITELSEKFGINTETTEIRNIEFGVNINTPVPVKQVLKDLVAYNSYTFGTLTVDKKRVGKTINQQRTTLKIYDKGLQFDKGKNLLRVEVSIKKMKYLEKYKIKTLADCLEPAKILPLGVLLFDYWDAIIYFDKKLNYRNLSEFERKKLLYYATPRNWSDFTIKQRYRAKKHFKKLIGFHGSKTHFLIGFLIAQKWLELSAKICPQINLDFKEFSQTDFVHKLTLIINGYFIPKTPLNKNPKFLPKKVEKMKPKKKRICKVCKTRISHKKADAVYCSKKCNNVHNGKRRTKKRQQLRKQENYQLKKLLKFLPSSKIELIVTYKNASGTYSDQLIQSEIGTTKGWIKKVIKVKVIKANKTIVLTSYRARRLINNINNQNNGIQ